LDRDDVRGQLTLAIIQERLGLDLVKGQERNDEAGQQRVLPPVADADDLERVKLFLRPLDRADRKAISNLQAVRRAALRSRMTSLPRRFLSSRPCTTGGSPGLPGSTPISETFNGWRPSS